MTTTKRSAEERQRRSRLDKLETFLLVWIAIGTTIAGLGLIGMALAALTSESFARELRGDGQGNWILSAVLVLGGVALLVQTARGHAAGYVWQSVATTLRKDENPWLYRLLLVAHYASSVAMVLFGLTRWR